MSLQEKYAELISAAQERGATNLSIKEQENVLHIDGEVATGEAKDQLWSIYDRIDPDYRSGDVAMNINVTPGVATTPLKVNTQHFSLSVRKGPETDQPVLCKTPHASIVTLLSKYNDAWYLVRSAEGVEGYAAAEYLTAL